MDKDWGMGRQGENDCSENHSNIQICATRPGSETQWGGVESDRKCLIGDSVMWGQTGDTQQTYLQELQQTGLNMVCSLPSARVQDVGADSEQNILKGIVSIHKKPPDIIMYVGTNEVSRKTERS